MPTLLLTNPLNSSTKLGEKLWFENYFFYFLISLENTLTPKYILLKH